MELDDIDSVILIRKDGGQDEVINSSPPPDSGVGDDKANPIETAFERLLNGFRTRFERDSNDARTSLEQDSDADRTLTEQDSDEIREKNKNQTAAANLENENKVETTPKDFCELNAEVVDLLNNGKFIKKITKRRRLKYIFSVPEAVRLAINEELGTNITPYTMNKIRFCSEYQKRFSPITFWTVVLTSVIIFALILWPRSPKEVGEEIENSNVVLTHDRKKDSLFIRNWAIKNGVQFTGYRYGLMLKNSKFVNGSESDRIGIMKSQLSEQNKAMQK